jgi:TorA maturation chaperone TorD
MSLALLADLAQFLAEAFLEPDADLVTGVEELQALATSPALAQPLGRMLATPLSGEAQAVEYTRLFLQARDTEVVHLFESVQARGHHMAPEVLGPLKAIHDEADISLQDDLGIPPDHLGLELACLSHLLGQVIEGDLAERPRLVALAQRLIAEHLRPFVRAVGEQLPQVHPHPTYQGALDLAAALLPAAEKALAEI